MEHRIKWLAFGFESNCMTILIVPLSLFVCLALTVITGGSGSTFITIALSKARPQVHTGHSNSKRNKFWQVRFCFNKLQRPVANLVDNLLLISEKGISFSSFPVAFVSARWCQVQNKTKQTNKQLHSTKKQLNTQRQALLY